MNINHTSQTKKQPKTNNIAKKGPTRRPSARGWEKKQRSAYAHAHWRSERLQDTARAARLPLPHVPFWPRPRGCRTTRSCAACVGRGILRGARTRACSRAAKAGAGGGARGGAFARFRSLHPWLSPFALGERAARACSRAAARGRAGPGVGQAGGARMLASSSRGGSSGAGPPPARSVRLAGGARMLASSGGGS